MQLVSITVQELGQISSLVQDLDNRVADQYSLTDVQIDEVSCSLATAAGSDPDTVLVTKLVKLSAVADKEDLPLEKRRLVALDEIRRLQKSCTAHGRVLLREPKSGEGVRAWLITDTAFAENCEALLLLVR